MFITDEQWEVLQPVLEVPKSSVYGRPRANAREVFEAILFILHTGIQWKYLPKTFPPKSTVHDYLQFWSTQQAFRKLLALVIRQLMQKGCVDLQQCFVDAIFAVAKGGGEAVGLTRKGKGAKIQLMVDAQGIPLAVSLDAADRAESHMVQQTLAWEETEIQPERLIGDKAYDCDALDDALAELGIEMISPHRRATVCRKIKPRMDDPCVATVTAGWSSAPSRGLATIADCSPVGKNISPTFLLSHSWAA
jgi:transposase